MALADLKVLIALEGGAAVVQGLSAVDAGMHKVASSASGALSSGISRAVEAMRALGAITLATSAAIGGLASVSAFQTAVKLDSLTRGLASVSVNAADLRAQLSRLREVAKLPGLGFEEAVSGSVALQSAGLSARLAERSLMAFGNALATVGKGKADLSGVTLALQQISAKGKVSAEEINQINERVPQIRKAMQSAFGTSDTEALSKMGISTTQFIEGVVKQLEKLPKITGGIGNDIENLQDGIKNALLPLGNGLVAMFSAMGGSMEKSLAFVEKLATKVGEVLAAVGKSGELGNLFQKIFGGGVGLDGLQDTMLRVIANILAVIGNVRGAVDTIKYNIGQVSSYLGNLFDNLAAKARLTFSFMVEGVSLMGQALVLAVSAPLQGIKNLLFGLGLIGPAVAKLLEMSPMGIGNSAGMQAIKGGISQVWEQYQSAMSGVDAANPVASPQFKSIDMMQGADSIYKNLKKNLSPLPSLPENMSFGGVQAQAQSASSGIWAQWDKYLSGIEKNTKKSADLLDSRQTLGGGELARAGVSGSEMARYAAARYQRLYGRG